MKTAELEAMLRPPGKADLNTVIARVEAGARPDYEDLQTLILAARYGRQRAEEEIARHWGTFG